MKKVIVLIMTVVTIMGLVPGCTRVVENPAPDVQEEEPGEIITLDIDTLENAANNNASYWELLQSLVPTRIVYKSSGGKYVFEPINEELPKSEYDWSKLVEVSKSPREVMYVEDGQPVSIKGIDVSQYQDQIDWAKVSQSGVKYAIIRVGYRGYETGKMVTDAKAIENLEGATSNGIGAGAYFVTQAVSVEEAVEEAKYVLDVIKPYDVSWPIVIDIEDTAVDNPRTALLTRTQRTDNAIAFCETIKEAGYTPMLYCNIRWFIEMLDITRLTDYDKWFAQYFEKPFFPYEFQMWQYSSSGKIDGIKGNVDMNISFVNYGEL